MAATAVAEVIVCCDLDCHPKCNRASKDDSQFCDIQWALFYWCHSLTLGRGVNHLEFWRKSLLLFFVQLCDPVRKVLFMDCVFNTNVFFFRIFQSIIFFIDNKRFIVAQSNAALVVKDDAFNVLSIKYTFNTAVEGGSMLECKQIAELFLRSFSPILNNTIQEPKFNSNLFNLKLRDQNKKGYTSPQERPQNGTLFKLNP